MVGIVFRVNIIPADALAVNADRTSAGRVSISKVFGALFGVPGAKENILCESVI